MKGALCIGHLAYDIVLPLDRFPTENMKYQIDRCLESSGGPAANAASLLALWGNETAFMGTAGKDTYGERALLDLQNAGVDIRGVCRKEHLSTPLSIILVNTRTGSRTIINRKGGGSISTEEAMNLFAFFERNPPDLLLFDGHEPDASLAALEKFPHAISILDAGSLRKGTELLAPRVDYCIASERFAREVAGISQIPLSTPESTSTPSPVSASTDAPIVISSPVPHSVHPPISTRSPLSEPSHLEPSQAPSVSTSSDSCRLLLNVLKAGGIQSPVITLGEQGCCFLMPGFIEGDFIEPEASYHLEASGFLLSAYPAKALDTTGAGDIFHGAFAAALLWGKSFREALCLATVAAGLSVTRLGGRPSIPSWEEVRQAMEGWVPEFQPLTKTLNSTGKS